MHKIKILDISSTIHPMIDIFHIFYIEIKLKYCNETIRKGEKRRELLRESKKNNLPTNTKKEFTKNSELIPWAANNSVNFQVHTENLMAISDCAYLLVAKESEGKVKQRTTIRRFESWPAWGRNRASTFAT